MSRGLASTLHLMRALLVVNPTATTTSARTREVLTHALASDLDLELALTERRGAPVGLPGA